ncbi:hypothetical protein GGF31_005803 [Allomyces arbusculus]|nr:hypothetical protein GGF31_005803 [Allomyces arbusculus]
MTMDISDIGLAPPKMQATKEQMDAAKVPYLFRDFCAHLYIEMEQCRKTHPFMAGPKCHGQKHAYEECQYREYIRRMRIAEYKRKQEAGDE